MLNLVDMLNMLLFMNICAYFNIYIYMCVDACISVKCVSDEICRYAIDAISM